MFTRDRRLSSSPSLPPVLVGIMKQKQLISRQPGAGVQVPARVNKTQANLAEHSNTFLSRFNTCTHIKVYGKNKGITRERGELEPFML